MHRLLSLRDYHSEQILHAHDHEQLVFGVQGCLEFEIDGLGGALDEQRLAIIPAGAAHACYSANGSRCLVLDPPSRDWLRVHSGAHAERGLKLLERSAMPGLRASQQALVAALAAGPLDDPLFNEQAAALLLSSLLAPPTPAMGSLQRLRVYIDTHLAYPLMVEDLAAQVGLSNARLHARCLDELGCTPMTFVRHRRLLAARRLLAESDLAIGEIAARVGYASQSAFTAAMVREHGHTPRQYRRELRDNSR